MELLIFYTIQYFSNFHNILLAYYFALCLYFFIVVSESNLISSKTKWTTAVADYMDICNFYCSQSEFINFLKNNIYKDDCVDDFNINRKVIFCVWYQMKLMSNTSDNYF